MKVLHVIPSFAPAWYHGGAVQSTLQLCLRLPQHGCDVRVLTTDSNGPDEVLNIENDREVQMDQGLRVRYCHRKYSMSFSFQLLRLLPSYIRWADVVHLTAVYSFPTIPTLLLCKMMNKPVIWSPRGSLQRWEGSSRVKVKAAWERICRVVAPKRLTLHVTSSDEKRESIDRLPGAGVVIIPNGVEIPEGPTHQPEDETLHLLFLGRIDPKKGIENLLEACRLIDERINLNWTLTIAGAGDSHYTEALRKQISEFGLTDKVKMVGHVGGDEKKRIFEDSSVLVVPSFTENFGIVVAEALAHTVPVIASTGTPWQCIEEISCGLWVDNDPESLVDAIDRISQMPLRDMGLRGRTWMQKEFSWGNRSSEMFKVYQEMVSISNPAYQ